METFNWSLEIVVLSNWSLSQPSGGDDYHYDDRTTKVTGQVFGQEMCPFADLERVIRAHVLAYYSKIDRPKANPFIAAQPKFYDVIAWASMIENEGEVGSHIHYDGHLSGCYTNGPQVWPFWVQSRDAPD